MDTDIRYMKRALTLALKAKGQTSPNPLVGCVIVKAGKVVAEGWHKYCGGDHAEIDALKKAGTKARGATMYVTLEPCAHWGKTPPCVEAVIKAGIKRVVVGMRDPNPLTNGASLRKLRAQGIEIQADVLKDQAQAINVPFCKYITTKMPFVVAKSAQTIDGKIATRTGDSKWITSAEARDFARAKRAEFDAILVGVNTVIADDPKLTAPGKDIKKIVVDSTLRVPQKARLFSGAKPGQIILATTKKAPVARVDYFSGRGVRVVVCAQKNGQVDLKALFKELARTGIASILIEGGAQVIGSALKAGLVDKMHVYIAPKIVGDARARASVVGVDITKIAKAKAFEIRDVERIGKEVFVELCSPELLK